MKRRRKIFLGIVVGGMILGAAGWWGWEKVVYEERDEVLREFAKVPGISDVQVLGFMDVTYEANGVSFKLAGRPDTLVVLSGPSLADLTASPPHLWLTQLGPWAFLTREYGSTRATDAPGVQTITNANGTWKQMKIDGVWRILPRARKGWNAFSWAIDVGPASAWAKALPLTLRNVQDVAAHYDELAKTFASWPGREAPGRLTNDAGDMTDYCVVKADEKSQGWPKTWNEDTKDEEETWQAEFHRLNPGMK